jgi:hypothetical protein
MPFTGVHTSVVVAFALAIKNAKVTT